MFDLLPPRDRSRFSNSPSAVPIRKTSRSERALDLVTFFLADVADGLGPFLVIDLTTRRGWSSAEAGLAMASLLIGTVLTQSVTGAWIDSTRHKRRAILCAALVVAFASIALYFVQTKGLVFALQGATGVAVTVFPPAIAAISLGMVGRARLPARAGRNEACFHAGNVVSALLAIGAHQLFGAIGIFFGVAAMAGSSAFATLLLREGDIDHRLARGADRKPTTAVDARPDILPPTELLRDRRLLWFVGSVVLFHFANAAMLPLVGQKLGHLVPESAPTLMGVCVIVAQVTMVPVALLASKGAAIARRPIFLIGFLALPVRGILYTWTDVPACLVAVQVLDGVGAGIFGVTALLVMADLTRGTGRFNFAQGLMATAIGVGAAASNYVTGCLVDARGYDAGFLFLSAIAVVAVAVFALTVPETAELGATAFAPLPSPAPAGGDRP